MLLALCGRRMPILNGSAACCCGVPWGWLAALHIQTKIVGMLFRPRFLKTRAPFTIIFSHGNATDCGASRDRYSEMANQLGVNVFGYDYSGYGGSTGNPSERNTYSDIDAAYEWLCSSGTVCNPGAEIILYGQSIGSGPSCALASRREVRAVVLHAPILSGIRVLL